MDRSGGAGEPRRHLDACVKNIQWLVDRVEVSDEELMVNGWAISLLGDPRRARFLLNGREFEHVEYPLKSPDIEEIFWNASSAREARFACRAMGRGGRLFEGGFARFEFHERGESQEAVRRKAWYFPDPSLGVPIPEGVRIDRVIGAPDTTSYLLGGATVFKRAEELLKQQLGRDFGEFPAVLDWGCGSGRVSRYLAGVDGIDFWGADVDVDNVEWCQRSLVGGRFSAIPLIPPTDLPENHFDLVFGISVLTHLSEANQFLWLKELKRITKEGAILLLSVHGLAQLGLYRPPVEVVEEAGREPFLVTGRNTALDGLIEDEEYYINVIQSREYIQEEWGQYFTILEIVDALAANQDLVILRNDG